jgi:group I intron endonuclease
VNYDQTKQMNIRSDNGGVTYLIKNLINGKCYVGITSKDERTRFQEHIYDSNKTIRKYAIHRAIHKHGANNFSVAILEKCSSYDSMRVSEKFWIATLKTHISGGAGYNMTTGGDGVHGHIVSDSQRKNMSRAANGKIFSEQHKFNISRSKKGTRNPFYGKNLSDDHKQKIGLGNTGKVFSEQRRTKISQALTGKKQPWTRASCRTIDQVDPATNEHIITHKSIHEAARSISEKASPSNILYACTGKRRWAYGFIWKYAEVQAAVQM